MESHLPPAVLSPLTSLLQAMEEGLQAESHRVSRALDVHSAFNRGFVDSTLTRALLSSLGENATAGTTITFVDLSNGGCEFVIVDSGRERRFRLKSAGRYRNGGLRVTVNSDSFLTHEVRERELWDDPAEEQPGTVEQWVLAYRMNPMTRTFLDVWAALPIGLIGETSPYRLAFGPVIEITLTPPVPPPFQRDEDDLDFDDDEGDEQGDEGVG
ncbi:MAG TPA: hypothetical protein VHF47_14390 [Acidimicrobiales bacterium]|nr:hypothetical protein [Acidimicrobiales bacterium]